MRLPYDQHTAHISMLETDGCELGGYLHGLLNDEIAVLMGNWFVLTFFEIWLQQ